jgi:hypothetical protein
MKEKGTPFYCSLVAVYGNGGCYQPVSPLLIAGLLLVDSLGPLLMVRGVTLCAPRTQSTAEGRHWSFPG